MIASTNSFNSVPDTPLHAAFLELLPRIQTHAEIYFRGMKCPAERADAIQETVALAWKWFNRVTEKGKDINQFAMVFIFLVAKGVKHGRRLAGMHKSKDVMNPLAQQKHSFTVERLPTSTCTSHEELYGEVHGQKRLDTFEERLRDNTQTPIPDQVTFRIDFPAWLNTLTGRERRLIQAMLLNERTKDLSKEFEVSPGRISQLRREFERGWKRFCQEEPECGDNSTAVAM